MRAKEAGWLPKALSGLAAKFLHWRFVRTFGRALTLRAWHCLIIAIRKAVDNCNAKSQSLGAGTSGLA
jgi:hypothetical protein